MKGHKAPIHSLSFSAESSVLVSGSADSTVRVWDAKAAGGDRGSSSARPNGSGIMGADSDAPSGGARVGNERGGLPMGPGDWDGATYVHFCPNIR
jgi:transcription initiation factor TFIID subunit 5